MKFFHTSVIATTSAMVLIMVNTALLVPKSLGTSAASAHFPTDNFTPKHSKSSTPSSPVPMPIPATAPSPATTDATDELTDMQTATGPDDGNLIQVSLNYDLDAVFKGSGVVPRFDLAQVNTAKLPPDLAQIRENKTRKAIFFKTVLPLILRVNEQIGRDRARLKGLAQQQRTRKVLDAIDRLWLAAMADRYGTTRGNINALLIRHDVVPPSLALAQAATESAWGASRFVREGNAMFGEWTFSREKSNMVPLKRDQGKSHRIRAFGSLYDSIFSYVTNLNKHRAYKEFRTLRATMRRKGEPLNGMTLAGTLYRYSERGAAYVAQLRSIISNNDLTLLDGARLSRNDDADFNLPRT